ncbi:response regulator transcription factor [Alicyclobacillus pomorum]|uniref:response regulator transcription factor n=1 Tax=Alicyclobacillus pomorum TaxID=204470 RepID=UPI000408785A|nr:response regulator transcription factor [Alicyclobacillus pomorum]
MRNHILLVEDDNSVAYLLQQHLERFGFRVSRAQNLQHVDDEVKTLGPDLVLLDINLPYFDGFYWCRQIRMFSKVPIIFVSARDSAMDQVFALEHGGDEYITKPFEIDVVIAKIRAMLRRAYGEYAESQGTQVCDVFDIRGTRIDLRRATMESRDATESLTKTELALMRLLLEAEGGVVSRDTLLEALWDDTDFVDDNTLTVNVARLRKKLAVFGLQGALVTVRGLGYRFQPYEGDVT